MTAHIITLPHGAAATRTLGTRGHGKDWVVLGPNKNMQHNHGLFQPQLFFNKAIPASAYNRATRVGPPAPIVIEKLMARPVEQEDVDVTRSSVNFSTLSEEQLWSAVRLAKRDLRRRRHESLNDSSIKPQRQDSPHNTSHVDQQEVATVEVKSKASSPKEKLPGPGANLNSKASSPKEKLPGPGANLLRVCVPQELSIPPSRVEALSPPTRDPGPGREPQLGLEMRKLQSGLEVYIQRIEELNRGQTMEEPLEPDEQHKMEIHQQQQAARSARIIYGLHHQVREIQEDLDKLRSQKIGHTKKSRAGAMERLAAAHRAAVRAIQAFTGQLPGPDQGGRVPAHHKELAQLLRQLSLCSAQVDVDRGSAVPQSALDILKKLETLDIALSKQERPWRGQAEERSSSPAWDNSPLHGASPPRVPRGPTSRGPRRLGRAAVPRRSVPGRRAGLQNPRATCRRRPPPPVNRKQVLRDALKSLVQKELRENGCVGSEHLERNKMQATGFQQPTVSSRLRVNQLPQKELSVPWIPTSPHSPPAQRRSPQRSRPEPRCLFSPSKPSTSPQRQEFRGKEEGLSSDQKKQAQQEALRQAWLDKLTIQRLRRLDQLSAGEAEGIQRLRSEVGSPARRDERDAEQTARGRTQRNEVQIEEEARNRTGSSLRHRLSEQAAERAAESAEQLSEALLEDLLDDAAQTHRRFETEAERRLQAPTLESMLLRMDEIQRDEDEVRSRCATITYSNPHYWDKGETKGSQWCGAPGSRPASPQPIRLTKPVARHTSTADIVLEKPVEAGHSVLSESSLTEEGSGGQQPGSGFVFPGPVERSRGTALSVPGDTLKNIQRYREEHDAYLRLVAHEAVGGFNPWAVADSLAEELLSEALADVAAEFQDICEEYAEAVFTSEFLQPIQSPPASLPPSDSQ